MIRTLVLTRDHWQNYNAGLQELESVAEYPYGDDHFKIDHGNSYFQFFERLGEPVFNIALDGTKIIACAAGVLRTIPGRQGPIKTWYLCDLKVHPDCRNQRLPAVLFRKRLLRNYLRCPRAYAISMNPSDKPNRVIEITTKFPWFPISLATTLNLYSLDYDQMVFASEFLKPKLGPLGYLSLHGKKDLIIKSTGKPMSLLHVQHGPTAEPQNQSPQKNFVHIMCAVKGSQLDTLLAANFSVSATASILAHGMTKTDWSFILTSDI